jgi:membrane protease YdiL (CAAX protease family)
MNKITDWIKRHQIAAFFLLTFLITWGFGALAIFLPAQFQALFGELTDTSPIYFLAIAAPTISATIMTFARDGWNGLRSLYARLIRWRFGIQWYALVLIGIPVLGWIAARFTESNPLKETNNLTQFLWLLFYLLITGPLCEELGWRGFALPRLLKRFSPFTASLALGVIWGVWHLPSFFVSGMVQNGLSAVMIHYMANICATILGVTLPTLGIILLTGSILVIVFDKQFGWFQKVNSRTRVMQLPPIPPASPLT